jgi:23S rRNA pseudouridine2605 synthase
MRLNLFISKSGYTSRRKADDLIKEGKVEVDGKICREPFFKVEEANVVKVKGRVINLKTYTYIAFHKPKGVVTTLEDKFALKKVIDFFPKKLGRIYPVGRLDKDSSGLLIFTNDGDFCYKVTHPKFSIEKEYIVKLRGEITANNCRKARVGVKDKGELLKVKEIKVLSKELKVSLCKVVVCEGKKRHLRRLFKQLKLEVEKLKRVRIGKLVLGGLKEGQYRKISPEAVL